MAPLTLGLVTFLAASSGPCFVSTDATPGWKQVVLPDEARALAAPEGVDQFRADEGLTIVDERSGVSLQGYSGGLGVTVFEFPLGAGGRSLDLRFAEPLRGAKVDVTASSELGAMSLLREQRVGGATLSLSWGQNDVSSVTVRVHDHLRRDPVLLGWKSVRHVPADRAGLSPAFTLRRSLYYRQPAGPVVPLCNAPEQVLTVRPDAPRANELPVPVTLKRL